MVETRWPGRWFRVDARLAAGVEDDAIGALAGEGCLGTATRAAGPGRITLTIWFDSRQSAERGVRQLAPWLGPEGPGPDIREEADTGWLAASLRAHPPIEAGRFLVVEAEPEAALSPDRLPVVIPRGRAFGTGEHETTRLCLELLDGHLRGGAVVADVGTGSGVLAIAAAKGGAARVLACDNDPAVIEVAVENAGINRVGAAVEVRRGSWGCLADEGPFDLVVANIHRTGVVEGARAAAAALRPGGWGVLSGFVEADAPRVVAAWSAAGFESRPARVRGGWAALELERRTG
jgi:ribosomal protein L11 methyltransferase